jgi:hypothetical protein
MSVEYNGNALDTNMLYRNHRLQQQQPADAGPSWTPDEDAHIMGWVSRGGGHNWHRLSREMLARFGKGRRADELQARWELMSQDQNEGLRAEWNAAQVDP